MINIIGAKYISGYELELTFNSGLVTSVDLSEELSGEVFEPLRNIENFKKFFINSDTGTIEWANGADFAPEFLLDLAKQQQHLHVV